MLSLSLPHAFRVSDRIQPFVHRVHHYTSSKKGSQAYSSSSGTPSIIRQAGPRVRTTLETRRYPIFHIFTPRKQYVADCSACDTPQLGLKRQLSIRKNLRHPISLVSRTHIHPGSNQVRLSWAVPEIHQDPAIRLVDQQPRLYFPLHHLHRVDDHLLCIIISASGRLPRTGLDCLLCLCISRHQRIYL